MKTEQRKPEEVLQHCETLAQDVRATLDLLLNLAAQCREAGVTVDVQFGRHEGLGWSTERVRLSDMKHHRTEVELRRVL